jgi:threonine aldolase
MNVIDLRSDTVTRPAPDMRRAMAEAEVGDDVYGEDPTVNRLEQRAAEITGKEAALFVASGTMGNTIAIKLHTEHGQEVICESRSHVFNFELAMMGWFAGCLARPLIADNGILTWPQIRAAIRPPSPHWAPTGLIEIENTGNLTGGTVYPLDVIWEICDGAHALGLPVHMDGARVFNAAAALGVPVREVVAPVDTVMFCLSKGLGAPVGSMLAGTAGQIARARHYRKRLGGAMRQAGVLAAAGLIALEQRPARLHEDHENARFIAGSLSKLPGFQVDAESVRTNIMIVDVAGTGITAAEFSRRVRERGVLINAVNDRQVRIVTHLDVSREQCELAVFSMAEVATEVRQVQAAVR